MPVDMAFNADSTLVAVAYRGSAMEVWDIKEQTLVNVCKSRPTYEVGAKPDWMGVQKVVWHPSGETLLGVSTGIFFKWDPFEEFSPPKLQHKRNFYPSGIQCSSDGVLILLADSADDICFSMDSRRLYDLRRSYCTIWEPNSLFRLADSEDYSSKTDPEAISIAISNQFSEASIDAPALITTLAAGPFGGLFWHGNKDGLIEVNDISTLKSQRAGNTKREKAVEFLVISEDGNYMAYADINFFMVKGCALTASGAMAFETLFNKECHRESGRVLQISLHPKCRFLLVAGDKFVIVYDISTKEADGSQKWANHPLIEDQLLALNIDTVSSYSWKDLEIMAQWDINKPHLAEPKIEQETDISRTSIILQVNRQVQEYVDKILVSTTGSYAFTSISQEGPYLNRRSRIQIINLSDIQDLDSCSITPISIPNEINITIEHPLGIIGKDRLVFIDRSFWICSWSIGSEQEKTQRHFFLPRDWVTTEMLALCAVTGDGIVLVPRKGEVAVIQSSLCTKQR
ncbi:hypothetical protein VE03_06430 [Pseudogymnoascus sp. 23342-1-I1]|nr:hypothetical protein VE03_06430 [Pseudogymnoascus sp. 23342-1-I1]